MGKQNQFVNKIVSYLRQLADETDAVKKSEFFKRYLGIMSKFWKYSYRNQLLIMAQMPQATRVAGFRKWQNMKRWVKKGSKAIKILAPGIRKATEEDQETGEDIEKEEVLFFPVNVFDVSQTRGEPLPEVDITVQGDSSSAVLQNLLEFCRTKNIRVDFRNLGINGLYGYSKGGSIAVTSSETINTQANILIHEVAHEVLSHKNQKLRRQQREIQAEGVAYVVTKHFGIENKSFRYLALYDADYKRIMENLEAIARASKEIIAYLEEQITVPVAA